MPHNTTPPSTEDDRPSKSQVKRDMHVLHDLGKELVELPTEKLKKLPLSEVLFEAIRDAQRNTSREGRRRQIHYVGKLMRSADTVAILQQIDIWRHGSREETHAMHRLETLRDILIKDDDALTGFLEEYPNADVQQLRTLIRAARKEMQHNATQEPGREPQRKHYRALYQALKLINDSLDEK